MRNREQGVQGHRRHKRERPLTAPPAKYFGYATGDVASISASVQGIQGCQPLDNCVTYLPIATVDLAHPPIDSGSNKQVWTIGFAAFLITQTPPTPTPTPTAANCSATT